MYTSIYTFIYSISENIFHSLSLSEIGGLSDVRLLNMEGTLRYSNMALRNSPFSSMIFLSKSPLIAL